jgi:LEA14-like dessication related protein
MARRSLPWGALLAAWALGLGACAGLGQRLAAPKVEVVAVALARVQDAQAHFVIRVELANPNAVPIDVEAFDAALAIEGEVVATAKLAAPARVPAGGTAQAELAAQAGVDALVRAAIAAMRRGAAAAPGRNPSLRYAIEGTAVFNGGLRVPFAKGGELGGQGAASP